MIEHSVGGQERIYSPIRKKKNWLTSDLKITVEGFLGGAVVGNLPADAGDTGSSPGLGGSHMPRSS